jgi:hypothetical protein
MKRSIYALFAATLVAAASGCCCFERMFCHGCCGGTCGYGDYYGHEGPCCGSCGYPGGGHCSDCASVGRGDYRGQMADSGGAEYYDDGGAGAGAGAAGGAGPQALVSKHPADGHPLVRQRRNAGGEYEFAAGPPTGGVTYPYYTNRGPRDFLARNPRGIGP